MIDTKALDRFIIENRHPQINAALVIKGGDIIAERYSNGFTCESRNTIKSCGKSITAAAAGLALDRGSIKSLDEPIYKYLPEFGEGRDPFHRIIKLRHLLTMSSGIFWNGGVHYHCPMLTQLRNSTDWVDFIADIAVKERPGLKFNYKEWDVILLAALIERAIDGDLFNFIDKNLYKPLGIKSKSWYKSPCGVAYSVGLGDGGEEESLSNLTAREMAKIGALYLHGGVYEGKRILSEAYVSETLAPSSANATYGLMWWLYDNGYGARGFGGQHIVVFPEKDAVLVLQSTATSRPMMYDDVITFVGENL